MFRERRPELVQGEVKDRLDGLRAGILHLHSLGLFHNDINPGNVMLDEDGNFILIDFDSCRHIGEDLKVSKTGRTYGWHDLMSKMHFQKTTWTLSRSCGSG
ncbi:hypothetical protein VI817_004938 [Penicillium citrinum]|nr:hypothetical protein VI817_004938 [Penicillium citrinum]